MHYNYSISNIGVNAMARKRKSDTQKTLEALIWVIFAIPLVAIALIKVLLKAIAWFSTKFDHSPNHKLLKVVSIDLEQIDRMDGLTFEHYVAELLKKNGYTMRKDLFAAPYDWRLAPVGLTEYWPKLQMLIHYY